MTLVIVCVKDRALDAFMRPFFAQTTGQAVRSFQDEINNPESPMNKHPDDYDLYHIGVWDDQTGEVVQTEGIRQIAIGKNCILQK